MAHRDLVISFPFGEMSITLDNVLCLLHLLIRGKLLDHERISKDEALELMVDYVGVDTEVVMSEMERTKGAHARFEFLKKVYTYELLRAQHARGDNEQVGLHKVYAIIAYLLYLVGIAIFVDKSATYTDLVYLRYFEDFKRIHEYNWGTTCLVYLYSKLSEGCRCKMKQVIGSICWCKP
ncbi:protein MAINTENANCE OF MERISTEMS-like [Lathyrus oleraceus]|uniref:protein MAINTENANCE OF MERISTEMS-like n=1 Tax=Pisum sativum TaxID=3888 RepID=UPI0021CE0DA9|nr:protein MAINTENANCE OF MERISTEMS-like [Pisum sativum]